MRSSLVKLLSAKNPCSDWFNQGTKSALNIISNVPILEYTPKNPYFDMPDGNTGQNPETPIYVNSLGRFNTNRYNSNLVGGLYSAGSPGAQIVILLHELAHKVNPPGFTADDADTPGNSASNKNTQMVIDHCAKTIDAQKQWEGKKTLMNLRSLTIFVLLLALLQTQKADQGSQASEKEGTLVVLVTFGDVDNTPATDVHVEAYGFVPKYDSEKPFVLKRSNAGRYEASLPPGVYDVFVSEGTSEPRCRRMRIREGMPSTWTLKLEVDEVFTLK
jgi:hypothetical protein